MGGREGRRGGLVEHSRGVFFYCCRGLGWVDVAFGGLGWYSVRAIGSKR